MTLFSNLLLLFKQRKILGISVQRLEPGPASDGNVSTLVISFLVKKINRKHGSEIKYRASFTFEKIL